ncbi:HNH endonuclease signature motif containing protein [Streptomyces sp. MUM 178J]|uniref:HNH endonuclease signature motif containing protein n=1 Tax=Streptomyces sp. MUM 178J TaxID=2791991 RepID=UPI001F04C576|nr:HNH endonuclease signature motif containing protein [Streptomyces sp. MUM 178J]WRQ81709.1 HNH endonuclease signature motif containing protein [Streptomyces sp. MUM 178J]
MSGDVYAWESSHWAVIFHSCGCCNPLVRAAAYEKWCRLVERREESTRRRRRERLARDPIRLGPARKAVLLRSGGHCENPACAGQPADVTDRGEPILEVDHIVEITRDGPDHPSQMIALCPNCHAVKTRGRSRDALRKTFLEVALERHRQMNRSLDG